MTEFATFTGKNVDEAVNNALLQLQITSEKLEYEVVEKGSNGLLGFIGSKPAVIRARKKSDFIDEGEEFLQNIFHEMNMEVDIAVAYNKEEQVVDIVLTGEDMGILIGKRGAKNIFVSSWILRITVKEERKLSSSWQRILPTR